MAKKDLTDKDYKVIRMWNEGLTATEIAETFATTRSAILGRLHRLKARGIEIKSRKSAGETPQVTDGKVIKEQKVQKKKYRTIKIDYPPKKSFSKGEYLTITDLTSRSCRFIVNDGDHGVYLFCGKDREIGAYCSYHAKMCYIPTEKKKTDRSKEFTFYKYGKRDAAH